MSMIDKGLSGLNASRAALSATSNNIANSLVSGYTRQQVMTSSAGGGFYGEGSGVQVDGVRRISDQYEVAQLWATGSAVGYAKTQATYYGQVEKIFAGEGNNISAGLDDLFASLNSALQQPNEIAFRQGVLNEANNISQRFNSISQGLNTQVDQIEGQIKASVTQVNAQLKSIAELNAEIQASSNGGNVPSALLDARDSQINELAQILNVDVVSAPNDMLNISLPNGQPLLVGARFSSLETQVDPADPKFSTVNIKFGDTRFPVNNIEGGSLGGMIDYRDNELKPSFDFIDELATHFATEFNTVLAAGTDLSGATPTKDLFIIDPNNPAGSLRITADFTAEELAFGKDGTPGDNSNLRDFISLAAKDLTFGSIGAATTLSDAFTSKIGSLGSQSKQAQTSLTTQIQLQNEAQTQWASTSGVNIDEEGANLIIYQQAYQSNAKIIAIADELFQTVLNNV
ncbi:flagellar hook-associated protein FlgK [Shewanella sp. OPT22]|nr:flagellar hook-associated protein FlgK [Shewanella sp. OPT22]